MNKPSDSKGFNPFCSVCARERVCFALCVLGCTNGRWILEKGYIVRNSNRSNKYCHLQSFLTSCACWILSNFGEPYPLLSGNNRCLDAVVVALKQACDGGEKRWYGSTRELQLASLTFCRACRSVPTMHVRVDGQAPPSVWYSHQSPALPNPRSSRVHVSSRVPVVRAPRLT